LRNDGKGCLRIETQTFVGIFQFIQVCDRISELWKKTGITADLSSPSRRAEALTIEVTLPLERPHRLQWMASPQRSSQ
jgi:hypothetical protein